MSNCITFYILTTVIALALFQIGVFRCGPVRASMLSTLEPITSVLIGIIVLKEKLSVTSVIGIIFVLTSALLLLVKNQEVRTTEEKAEKGENGKTGRALLLRPEQGAERRGLRPESH